MQRMKRTRRSIIYFLFAAFLSTFIVQVWLPGDTLILGHDSGYRLPITEFWKSLFSTWAPVLNFGSSVLSNPAVLTIHIPEVLAWILTRDIQITQRVVFIFWHTINLVSILVAWLYIGNIKSWKISYGTVVISSVLYAINFLNLHAWSVIWRTKFSVQFLLPLLIFFLYKTLFEGAVNWKKLILISMTAALFNGGGSPPLYGPLMVGWVVTAAYVLGISARRTKTFFLFLKITTAFILLFSLFSSFWLIPYIYYAATSYVAQLNLQGGTESILGIVDAVSKNASILNIFRMQGLPAWDRDTQFPFMLKYINSPFLIIASFVWPLASIGAYFLSKNSHEKRFVGLFLALLFVGMFFTAGSHAPTGFLFSLMVEFIPGFGIFRTAFYKFGILPLLATSVLAGFTFSRLAQMTARHFRKQLLKPLLVAGSILGILAYHAPFIQGNFFDYNLPFTNKVKLPSYVAETANYVHRTTDFNDKILLLPRFDESKMDGYTWGYWSPDPLPRMVMHRPIVSDANNPPAIVDALYRALSDRRFDDFKILLKVSGIRTILWRSDALYSDKKTTGENLESQEADLKALPGIRQIASFEKWRLYSVQSEKPVSLFTSTGIYVTSNTGYADFLASAGTAGADLFDRSSALINVEKPYTQGEIVSATCLLCDPHERKRLEGKFGFVPVYVLPHSRLYWMKQFAEGQTMRRKSRSPQDLIRYQYALVQMRISEIHEYVRTSNLKIQSVAKEVSRDIGLLLSGSNRELGKLTPTQRAVMQSELIFLLDGFGQAVKTLKKTDMTGSDFRPIEELFESQKRRLLQEYALEINPDSQEYILDIPSAGTYDLIVRGQNGRRTSPVLDGKRLSETSVELSAGLHRVRTSESQGVYAFRREPSPRLSPPTVQFEADSMTKFRVSVRQASDPYILIFNQTFDPGWTAYILSADGMKMKELPKHDHVQVNGYANGWYIDAPGDYDIEISYRPQQLVWVGFVISVVSWLALGRYLFFRRHA